MYPSTYSYLLEICYMRTHTPSGTRVYTSMALCISLLWCLIVLRKMFGRKREEAASGCREEHNDASTPYLLGWSNQGGWGCRACGMSGVEMHTHSFGDRVWRSSGRPRCRWEDDLAVGFKEMGWDDID